MKKIARGLAVVVIGAALTMGTALTASAATHNVSISGATCKFTSTVAATSTYAKTTSCEAVRAQITYRTSGGYHSTHYGVKARSSRANAGTSMVTSRAATAFINIGGVSRASIFPV